MSDMALPDLGDLEIEDLEFSTDQEGGLDALRMGHDVSEVGASCCCSTSSCSCST
ncbi:GE37468 family thiazolyl peptide [Actinomadura sp. DSM 109109]|nr:GE37468 family thiazolyl peptide [Actinomadura lepetitiana]